MKYNQIDCDLFIKNRAKFTAQMKPNSVAVFNSNDIYPVSADSTLPFAQHRDIFYLSGVDQEESILVLFPTASNPAHKEILFLKETNDHIAVWEGAKLNKEQAFDATNLPLEISHCNTQPLVLVINHYIWFAVHFKHWKSKKDKLIVWL
jgi:Xaa-Pro aminopeptidase